MTITALAAVAAAMTLPVLPANAQIDVYVSPSPPVYVTPAPMYTYDPPRSGAFGDRDRDGVPNIADNYNNNRHDRDRDGIPNRYDRDRDGDGVPNRWDSSPSNPWRR
jgi:hypothetical protein